LAITMWKGALGPEYPEVMNSLNNLALLYSSQEKYAQAEQLYKQVLIVKEKAFGPDHPEIANVLENMVNLYKKSGKTKLAKELEERVLTIRAKNL